MNNFTYDIPTIVHFGRGQITHLSELRSSGSRVLMVYGGGSIRRIGLYDRALTILNEAGLTVFELSGVEPNPKIQKVREGVEIVRREHIDMVLAIGGGSSIDTAKLIAAGALYDGDPWNLMVYPERIREALPIYVVLTLAATGSEMDNSTVVSDLTIHEKRDIVADCLKPTMSICDPAWTFSVSPHQTAAGSVDIMSHVFENYFTNVPGVALQAHLCEAILKTVIENAPTAIREPDNYDARANLMWCSSLALNNLIMYGAEVTWCVHPIAYGPAAFYDMTHGVALAILTPVWMEYVLEKEPEKTAPKLAAYAREVWGMGQTERQITVSGHDAEEELTLAHLAITRTADFFRSLGMPDRLSAAGIPDERHFREMAETASPLCEGCYVELTAEDIEEIYRRSF